MFLMFFFLMFFYILFKVLVCTRFSGPLLIMFPIISFGDVYITAFEQNMSKFFYVACPFI